MEDARPGRVPLPVGPREATDIQLIEDDDACREKGAKVCEQARIAIYH